MSGGVNAGVKVETIIQDLLSLEVPQSASEGMCEKSGCCSTTEDGSAVCMVPQTEKPVTAAPEPYNSWPKARSSVMLMVACVTSPCCTPLIVPAGLALLTGTPVALWISQNLGLVYGGLTLVSVISLMLAWRWTLTNGTNKSKNRSGSSAKVVEKRLEATSQTR